MEKEISFDFLIVDKEPLGKIEEEKQPEVNI
jgi:hypothetical protein